MSKKKKQPAFITMLQKKLMESGLGEVESADMGDNSCRYVVIQKGDIKIEISFDMKGEKIIDLLVARDVYDVVDEEVLFSFTNNQPS